MPSYQNNEAKFIRDDERDWDLEEGSTSGQQVQKCVLAADFVFVNNDDLGAVEAHRAKIRGHIEPCVKMMQGVLEARRPLPEEVHMATAYSQSHGSACLKRHVGAVIVDTDGLSISMGFNENPVGMLPCVNEYEYCYKDNDMIAKMERMGKVYCSLCGYAVEKLKKPWKCPDCNNDMKKSLFTNRNMELCTAIHAEERAIRSLHGRKADGATMYVTTFPCFQCARYIIDAGITKVVYVEAYPIKESVDFLQKHNVEVKPFSGFKARAFNTIYKSVE